MMEKGFQLSTRLQFHLLRHFTSLDRQYKDVFTRESGHSPEEIRQQLALPGSKFHPEFARNPIALWKIIKNLIAGNHFSSRFEGNRKIFSFNFEKEQYPGGIGTGGLVSLATLPDELRKRVKLETRDKVQVLTVAGISPPPAWEVHMVVILTDDPFIATIFPGVYAPPFPDPKTQDTGEYHKNKEFWENHVLVSGRSADNP